MHRPVVHRRDPRLEIITEAIERLIPRAVPAYLTVTVTETLPGTAGHDGEPHKHTWTGKPDGLAQHVFTALYGRPRAVEERSPLAQAEDAKRRRSIVDEVSALVSAGNALESAPWYPTRPWDLVHVHHPALGSTPVFGETYIVGDTGDGLLSLQLLAHTLPGTVPYADEMVGHYAAEAADCPIYGPWFEAGSQRLTIVRDGRPVHVGGAR
jgi:hypothetical protein